MQRLGVAGVLRGAIKRLGEPVIRQAVARMMREMGQQFVLGQTIQKAIQRAKKLKSKVTRFSYDMLGEAAMTEADAKSYYYAHMRCDYSRLPTHASKDIVKNPGISIKLSALHPRYDLLHCDQVMQDLVPRAHLAAFCKICWNWT